MKNGYIKLHRKLLDSPISKDAEVAWLWVVLLLKAVHKDVKIMLNKKIIEIKAGQLITGRKALAEATGINQYKIYRSLRMLENTQQIAQQHFTKYTVITILKWEKYQSDTEEMHITIPNKRTTNAQQMHTYNNVKEYNIYKERVYNIFIYWNKKKIIEHKELDNGTMEAIISKLKLYSEDEIKDTIHNYSVIIEGEEYYYKQRYTLKKFLETKYDEFKDKEIAHNNFLKKR